MYKASLNDLGQLLLLLRYTNAYIEFTIKTPQKLRRSFSRQFQTNIALTSIVFSNKATYLNKIPFVFIASSNITDMTQKFVIKMGRT